MWVIGGRWVGSARWAWVIGCRWVGARWVIGAR
jgi:hypothetical protein